MVREVRWGVGEVRGNVGKFGKGFWSVGLREG